MYKFEGNDVSLMNHIIYTIYNVENIDDMRMDFLKLLKHLIPFDTANFYLIESDSDGVHTFKSLINENTLKNPNVDDVLQKHMKTGFEIDNMHWLYDTKKSSAYRLTDLISEDIFTATDYYKELFVPFNLHFGAQTTLVKNGDLVGLLGLFRCKPAPNFTDKEIFQLDCLKDHLSVRLYNARMPKDPYHAGHEGFRQKYDLTPREYEILVLLFNGLSNDQIVQKLFISENTLRRHIYNLFSKLGIQERWQLYFL